MDFTQTTLKELNSLTQDEVNKLNQEEFLQYCQRSEELGNSYYVGGLMAGYERSDPAGWVNGRGGKVLRQNEKEEWYIAQSLVEPDYRIRPLFMDKERFVSEMRKRGAPEEKIEEFLAYESDYKDL